MFATSGGYDLALLTHLKNRFLGVLTAEGKGFEPLVRGYRTTVFKTVTFGRSVNLPCRIQPERGTAILVESCLNSRNTHIPASATRIEPAQIWR